MHLTPEQKQIGQSNFNGAVSFSRRSFLKGAVTAGAGLGAAYFGYEKLKGDPVRVGFIGTGDEGSILITQHPPAYMDIVAIADIRPTNRKRAFYGDNNEHRVGLIKKLGAQRAKKIKQYKDHRELLKDPDIEAVVISVPLSHHAPLAIDAMRAGKHVLTEKLMAHSITQCKNMIAVAEEEGRLLAVGHQRHYSVLYDNANDIIEKGLLGDVKFIRAQWHRNNSFPGRDSWNKPIPGEDRNALEEDLQKKYDFDSMEQLVNWRLYEKTGGGLMAELGSHQLDACSIFLGKKPPLTIQGFGGKNFYGVKGVGSRDKQEDQREIDDHVYVTFEFPGRHYHPYDNPDDIVIVTYSSINTNRFEPYGEEVFGSRGTLIMEQEQHALLFKEAGPKIGGGGPDQRLYVVSDPKGQPVMDASESLAPAQQVESTVSGKISRGYTEEMEHFCHCIRTNNYGSPKDGGLRCNGTVAMGDAIMALTSNLAMKYKKRIVFKEEWFDPRNPAVPENDPEIVG
ncbi:MAG: Gfo/Idh/MocA family oxidoreductase [Planctomycetes bacterium]|nr:Gfo/Idh/MocA family oxidoreductase [Planctomycetota bacterium]